MCVCVCVTPQIAEELEQARAESRTLRDEVQRLHDELALTREAADRLKGESGSAQDELGQLRNANSELVQENVTASLKLKQAEERTVSAVTSCRAQCVHVCMSG